jgi:transposase
MARTSKLLTDEIALLAEEAISKLGKSGMVAIKLRAVISAHKYGITRVAKIFGMTKATLISWIKLIQSNPKEFINLLSIGHGRGRKYPLTEKQVSHVKEWLKEDSQITIDALRQKIIDCFSISMSRSSVHRLMQACTFSYITPRPQHHKQDTESLLEVKKKSNSTNRK